MMKPSVGRIVWFYDGMSVGRFMSRLDDTTPMAASVIYVHPDGSVNLKVVDHLGKEWTRGGADKGVQLRDPAQADRHGIEDAATWMPYQVGQARAQGALRMPSPDQTSAAGTPYAEPAPSVKAKPIPMVPVTSSNIAAVGFDGKSGTLAVQFSSGSTYYYAGVTEAQATEFLQAESVGSHFARHIRGKFTGVQVGGKESAAA